MNNIPEIINKWIGEIDYPAQPAGLYEPIQYMLDGGGKRLRPTLLVAAALAGGAKAEDVRSQAVAIEMFHNFTLLHDDVMDNADIRHGRPTVHKQWNVATAILSGDMMLTMAGRFMAQAAGNLTAEVMNTYETIAEEVYQGQQYDMDYECRSDVTVEEYMEMIRLKTSVLLAAACKIGAMMGGFGTAACDAFYRYGVAMGLAFQLRDDFLDTYGDAAVFGKAIGGDILNNKNTWLRIMCRAKAPARLAEIENKTMTDCEKIKAVTALYTGLGLERDCMKFVEDYTRVAIGHIDTIPMDVKYSDFFKNLANTAITRQR